MKKFVVLFSTASLMYACRKEKAPVPQEQAVNKSFEYQLFAARNYNDSLYKNLTAQIRLQIAKTNYLTGEREMVWDSTITERKITEFPEQAQMIILQKTFPVLESHEKLTGSFGVKYLDGGYVSQFGGTEEVIPGQTSKTIQISL